MNTFYLLTSKSDDTAGLVSVVYRVIFQCCHSQYLIISIFWPIVMILEFFLLLSNLLVSSVEKILNSN